MARVELLDCTLRDGGWMNRFCFGTSVMQQIFQSVSACGIEYAELGYLDLEAGSAEERSMYRSMEAVRANGLGRSGEDRDGRTRNGGAYSEEPFRLVMIDVGKFPVERLPVCRQSGIDGIRVCFHKEDAVEAFRIGRKITELGYRLLMQPMVNTRYTEQEFTDLVRGASKEFPELTALYIVDSFGSMGPEEMSRRVQLADTLLPSGTSVGLHTHNSRGLSFRNASAAAELPLSRTLILDASILGIGKGAGNLRTEEISAWLNGRKHGNVRNYRPEALRPAEESLERMLLERPKIPPEVFALSARYRLTPSYASFFWQQQSMTPDDLEELLKQVPDGKKDSFDRALAREILDSTADREIFGGTLAGRREGKGTE